MRRLRRVRPDRRKLEARTSRTWRRILATGRKPMAATLYTRRTPA